MAAFQKLQFDHERQSDDISAERLNKLDHGLGRAAGREQVVGDDHVVTFTDRVSVNFERVPAVFQVIAVAFDFGGQLLRLANWHEARAQVIGQRRGEDETARLDSDYAIDFSAAEMFDRPVDYGAQPFGVFEQCGDVVEENAGFWKIGNFADQFFKLVFGHGEIFLRRSGADFSLPASWADQSPPHFFTVSGGRHGRRERLLGFEFQ